MGRRYPHIMECNRMKFERMSQTNIHGYQASVGDRTVEVIRSYAADWFV